MSKLAPEPLTGYLLLAETELGDPNFRETVVLLVQHDLEGAMGFVMNQPTGMNLGESTSSELPKVLSDYALFIGGPVDPEYLLAIHTGFPHGECSAGARILADGMVFEPDYRFLAEIVQHYGSETLGANFMVRFFSGYAGWAEGQLEAELSEKAWITMPASVDLVFKTNPEQMWKSALRKKGGVYWAYANAGYKPSLN